MAPALYESIDGSVSQASNVINIDEHKISICITSGSTTSFAIGNFKHTNMR